MTTDREPWITRLGQLGGFFELHTGERARPPAGDAVPWEQVCAPEVLTARFAEVRAALAGTAGLPVDEVDQRVAVSATQIGLAARLWNVALATVLLHRRVPDLSPGNLLASPVHHGQVPLGVADAGRGYAVSTLPEAARVIGEVVTEGSLQALDTACSEVGRTAERVLLSNEASALTGAARVLGSGRSAGALGLTEPQRAELGRGAGWLVALLLRQPRLARGGRIEEGGAFVRQGCCLYYRLPGHGLCGDCVIARRPDNR